MRVINLSDLRAKFDRLQSKVVSGEPFRHGSKSNRSRFRALFKQLLVKDQSQDWYAKLKARFYQRQQEMIEEVGVFQEQCVANLVSKPIDQMNLEAIECGLKNVSLDNQELVLNFQRQLYCELHKRRKTLFLNKEMVYLSGEFCAQAFASRFNKWNYLKKKSLKISAQFRSDACF